MIDFPASPTVGQTFTAAGVTWTWDGAKWLPSGLAPTVVGGINDNRIINGDMRIDARNNGSSGTANAYTADRWRFDGSQTGKGTWQRQTGGAGALANGFVYFLAFQSASAYAPLTGDTFSFNQIVEADTVTDFAWGTAGAQPVTLSFWVFSSLTGMFGGAIRNYPLPATRSCPFTYSIPVANTWTKITITIPGDTGGTWVMSGSAAAFSLHFDLGSGATFRAPAGAWAAGNYTGANGAVNVVATNAAAFNIAGVKLEVGSVATPYNRQTMAKSLADCQRYYQVLDGFYAGYNTAGNTYYGGGGLLVVMRAIPTVVTGTISNITNCSAQVVNPLSSSAFFYQMAVTAAGAAFFQAKPAFSAEL